MNAIYLHSDAALGLQPVSELSHTWLPPHHSQVNRSRDITRQAMRWFPEEEDGLKDMFVRYMAALPKSMMVRRSGW